MLGALLLLGLAAFVVWYGYERSHRKTRSMPAGLQAHISLPHEQPFELYHNALSLCSKKTRVCLDELGIPYKSHPIDLVETGRYENIGRAYLALHPGGIVPLLVHDGHPVYESHEQIRYVAAYVDGLAADSPTPSRPKLVPNDPARRAEMEAWVDRASLTGDNPTVDTKGSAGNCVPGLTTPLFAAMMVDIPASRVFEGLLFHRLKERPVIFLTLKAVGLRHLTKLAPASAILRRSARDLHAHLAALDEQLATSGGPWIMGEQYTLADVSWTVILERLSEGACLDLFVGPDHGARVAEYWQAITARPSYQSAIVDHGHPTVAKGTERVHAHRRVDASLDALLRPA